MNTSVQTRTAGYTIAAAVAILANTLLVFAKETNPALLASMKAALGHHWTTQAVVITSGFLILGYLLSRSRAMRGWSGTTLAIMLFCATAIAGIGLIGFFLAD